MVATIGRLTVEFQEQHPSGMYLTRAPYFKDRPTIELFLEHEEILALEDLIQIYKRGLK